MTYISDSQIEQWIKEDIPYIDLTTHVLGIGEQMGELSFVVREDGVVAASEEVAKIFKKLNVEIQNFKPSGTFVKSGETILNGKGKASDLHTAWKVSLNLLEYAMGIATASKKLLEESKRGNPDIAVVSTRKSFPGTKDVVVKAAIAGGLLPHRLGLSETILIFDQHKIFMGGTEELPSRIASLRRACAEKKIIAEVETLDEAIKLALAGIDAIQFDKVSPENLKTYVQAVKEINPAVTLIGAGGIHVKNAYEYALTGIDVIATSSIFHAKPLDIKARMEKI